MRNELNGLTKKELLDTGYFFEQEPKNEYGNAFQEHFFLKPIEFQGLKLYTDERLLRDIWYYINEWHFDTFLSGVVTGRYHLIVESVSNIMVSKKQIITYLEKETKIIMDELELHKPENRIFQISQEMIQALIEHPNMSDEHLVFFANQKELPQSFLSSFQKEWPSPYAQQFDRLINIRVIKRVNEYIIHLQLGGDINNVNGIIKPSIIHLIKAVYQKIKDLLFGKDERQHKSFSQRYSSTGYDLESIQKQFFKNKKDSNQAASNSFPAVYFDKKGENFSHSVIATYCQLKGVFIQSSTQATELIQDYGLKSGNKFYNQFYTKFYKKSNRLAANGESKKAYLAIVKRYQKVVELCEYHNDEDTKHKAETELQLAVNQLDKMFP